MTFRLPVSFIDTRADLPPRFGLPLNFPRAISHWLSCLIDQLWGANL
jgi:hypothetical protein